MIKEDKELLLRDLCGRLPYGVKCKVSYNSGAINDVDATLYSMDKDGFLMFDEIGGDHREFLCKPYLFPLSSMTEEIMDEIYNNTGVYDIGIDSPVHIEVGTTFEDLTKIINILYKHHIDINGLIPKGHAIDATGLNIY